MLGHGPYLGLLEGYLVGAVYGDGAVGEEVVHEALPELAGGCYHLLGGIDVPLDGPQHPRDLPLLGEWRKGNSEGC